MTRPKSRFNSMSDKLIEAGVVRSETRSPNRMDEFSRSLTTMQLKRLIEIYQTSNGKRQTLALNEILKRRTDGRLEAERGTPVASDFTQLTYNLTPTPLKQLRALVTTCLQAKFIHADNAEGGGIIIRKVKRGVSFDSVQLRLQDDIGRVATGQRVYFAIESDAEGFGVVLHFDHDDFVVTLPPRL